MDGSMDGWIAILRPFNRISVISGRSVGDYERLYAVELRLRLESVLPPVGLEPGTARSVGHVIF